jgi:nitrate reductase NapD
MNISGVIVRARPEQLADVKSSLASLAGVEIHEETEQGKLVVTLESESQRAMADQLFAVQDTRGVLSASLVYQYND